MVMTVDVLNLFISGSLDDYGSKLSSLQHWNVVNQPPAGHTCMFDSQPTLGDCLV